MLDIAHQAMLAAVADAGTYELDLSLATRERMELKRVLVALRNAGLLEEVDGLWAITECGRAALAAARR